MFDDVSKTPMTTLRCVVERIIYQNPENGYSVLKVKVKGYDDLVTLVGNLLEVPVGSVLLCRGECSLQPLSENLISYQES